MEEKIDISQICFNRDIVKIEVKIHALDKPVPWGSFTKFKYAE